MRKFSWFYQQFKTPKKIFLPSTSVLFPNSRCFTGPLVGSLTWYIRSCNTSFCKTQWVQKTFFEHTMLGPEGFSAEMVELDPLDPQKCLILNPHPRFPELDPHSWFLDPWSLNPISINLKKYGWIHNLLQFLIAHLALCQLTQLDLAKCARNIFRVCRPGFKSHNYKEKRVLVLSLCLWILTPDYTWVFVCIAPAFKFVPNYPVKSPIRSEVSFRICLHRGL